MWRKWAIFRNYWANFLQIWYVGYVYGGHKICELIEIGPVITEIRGVENNELADPVNNTLVHHMAFLTTDTRLCVLIHQDISGLIF